MVRVKFLGPIKKDDLLVDIKSLDELSDILKQDDSLQEWLECSAVAINDKLVKQKDVLLNDGDIITLLPPVCGG